jgi:cell division protein FtsB
MSDTLNLWHRRAIKDSSDLARDAFSILEDEVKALRKENADLKSEVEHLELKCAPPRPPDYVDHS